LGARTTSILLVRAITGTLVVATSVRLLPFVGQVVRERQPLVILPELICAAALAISAFSLKRIIRQRDECLVGSSAFVVTVASSFALAAGVAPGAIAYTPVEATLGLATIAVTTALLVGWIADRPAAIEAFWWTTFSAFVGATWEAAVAPLFAVLLVNS
jgi:hypothetical protein